MSARMWQGLTVVVVALILVVGWFLVVAPQRSSADDLRGQASAQEQSNQTLRLQIAQLQQRAADLPDALAELERIDVAIPADPATPALVRTLSDQARASGLDLVSITPGVPAPYVAATPAAATPTAAPTDGSTPAPAPAPTPEIVPQDLYVVPLAINVTGDFDALRTYLDRLETVPRAMTFTGTTINRSDEGNGRQLTMALTGSVFYTPAAALDPTTAPLPVTASPAPVQG